MIKRIISLCITASMLLMMFCTVQVNAENEDYGVLNEMGISINTDELDKQLTRIELAEFAIQLTKASIIKEGEAIFIDVPRKHKAFAAVNTVYLNGLMYGYSDGTFRPNDTAKAEDAAGMILSVLGYSEVIESPDFTKQDTENLARKTGIFKGVSNGILTNRALGKMLLNMLDAKVLEPAISGGMIKFAPGETSYMEQSMGYKTIKGIIQAVGGASIFGAETVSDGYVVLDGEMYSCGGIDMLEYLGLQVRASIDEDEGKIISVKLDKRINELVIDADDIEAYKDYTYTYYKNENTEKTVSFSREARLIFNGKNMVYDENLMLPSDGKVRLVDTDGNRSYDIVIITSAIYMKVSSYINNEKLNDSLMNLSIDIGNAEIICYENGVRVNGNSLTKGKYIRVMPDVMVYEKINGTLIFKPSETGCERIVIEIVPENVVEGEISSVSAEKLMIDTSETEYSEFLLRLIDAGIIEKPTLKSMGKFFLNEKNKLIAFDITSRFTNGSTIKYGYMTQFAYDEAEEITYITLIDDQAQRKVFNTSKNFRVNGQKKTYAALKNDETVANEKIFVNGAIKRQLVGYETDTENKIKNLYIAKDYANQYILDASGANTSVKNPDYRRAGYKGYDNERFSLDFSSGKNTELYRNGISHLYSFGENTIAFEIPKDPTNYKKYKVLSNNAKNAVSYNSGYYIKIYNADESFTIGALAIDFSESATAASAIRDMGLETFGGKSQACMITKKQTVYDEEEEEEKDIVIGKEFAYSTAGTTGVMNDTALNCTDPELEDTDTRISGNNKPYGNLKWQQLEEGDIILHGFDNEGNIEKFGVLFRYSELYNADGSVRYRELNSGKREGTIKIAVSKVISVTDDDSIIFSPNGSDDYTQYMKGKTNNVCVYNGKNTEVIDISEINPGDTIFTRSESGILKEIFVFR